MGVVESLWVASSISQRILVASIENPQKFSDDSNYRIKLQDTIFKRSKWQSLVIEAKDLQQVHLWGLGSYHVQMSLLLARSCAYDQWHLFSPAQLDGQLGLYPEATLNIKILELYMLAFTVATVMLFQRKHVAYGPCCGMGVIETSMPRCLLTMIMQLLFLNS